MNYPILFILLISTLIPVIVGLSHMNNIFYSNIISADAIGSNYSDANGTSPNIGTTNTSSNLTGGTSENLVSTGANMSMLPRALHSPGDVNIAKETNAKTDDDTLSVSGTKMFKIGGGPSKNLPPDTGEGNINAAKKKASKGN